VSGAQTAPAGRIGVAGPWFEDLQTGDVFDEAPAMTITEGHAAAHQAIVGDRLRLGLDRELSREVTGGEIVHPGLTCDLAIGQSTLPTQRVIGNLFYRGLALRRAACIGDTLSTVTEVLALKQNRPKPGRAASGLAALRVRTVDQEGRAVLDFVRCAMLPLHDPDADTGRADDVSAVAAELPADGLAASALDWRLDRFRELVPGTHLDGVTEGAVMEVEGGDVVSSAPELARMTLNIATAHADEHAVGGRRLVYGGHTIGIAASHLTRALPNLVTVVAWRGCDHLGPVAEGDTLRSRVRVDRIEPEQGLAGALVHLEVRVTARATDGPEREVLAWSPIALMAI
jgi:acyl dehydratase